MSSNTTLTVCGTALLAAVLGAVVALALHGTIAGAEAVTVITAVVGIAGGVIAHATGVAAGAKAASPPAPVAKPVP